MRVNEKRWAGYKTEKKQKKKKRMKNTKKVDNDKRKEIYKSQIKENEREKRT